MVSNRPLLKICGVTNVADAQLVGESGADFCGMLVNVGFSERSLSLQRATTVAAASRAPVVILLCDPGLALVQEVEARLKPYAIQLLGHESLGFVRELKIITKCRIWKTIHLPIVAGQDTPAAYARAGADVLLIDRMDTSEGFARLGGTGKPADWQAAARVVREAPVPVFLAGGISPDNVAQAIIEVKPQGIDLCSGVEAARGKKDPEKVRRLVKNFRAAISGRERELP